MDAALTSIAKKCFGTNGARLSHERLRDEWKGDVGAPRTETTVDFLARLDQGR